MLTPICVKVTRELYVWEIAQAILLPLVLGVFFTLEFYFLFNVLSTKQIIITDKCKLTNIWAIDWTQYFRSFFRNILIIYYYIHMDNYNLNIHSTDYFMSSRTSQKFKEMDFKIEVLLKNRR
jgi:hypothetical protein